MNTETFNRLLTTARARQDEILKTKGNDYTRLDPDRLANFKRVAAGCGLSPLQVWWVYFHKHIDSIAAFVKTGKVESEKLEGRFDDAINYLYLGMALTHEENLKTTRLITNTDVDLVDDGRHLGGKL